MEIKGLPSLRYFITGTGNGGTYQLFGPGRLTPHMTTYSQLIEKHTAAIRRDTRASSQQQVIRNHMTALHAFLRSAHKSEQSIVGSELGADFEQKLSEHLATTSTLGERSKADRKSLLRAWKSTYDGLASQSPERSASRERDSAHANGAPQSRFEIELKRALRDAGLSAKSAAKLAGVSTSAVGRWNRGALPNVRSRETISKLEAVLKIAPNTLVDCLDGCVAALEPVQPNGFRTRMKALVGMEFRLKANELSPEFLQEWRALLTYKTAVRPIGFKRTKTGAWTLSQTEHSATTPTVLNSLAGGICHTADVAWMRVSTFLGFVKLPLHKGGYGQDASAAQTLAWLCVPEAIDSYLTFSSQRSAGLKHEGHRTFCNFVVSLTREKYGYLRQNAHLIEKLPEEARRGREWEQLCEEAFLTAEAWGAAATDTSRNPHDGIAFFMSQKEPLRPVFDAMRRLRRLADGCTPGSVSEAVFRRDELLLGFFISNPLRAKNMKTLTWRTDNSAHIYRNSAGQWRLRIEPREFKNRRGSKRNKRQSYDVAIAKWLAPLLEEYVLRFRPVLVGESLDAGFLFLSANGRRMNDMNRRVFDITKKFIPGTGGISPHLFRHLVATVWLTEHPNDFFVVAELLNDTLAVVLRTYAHLKKDVSFSKYEAYVANMC